MKRDFFFFFSHHTVATTIIRGSTFKSLITKSLRGYKRGKKNTVMFSVSDKEKEKKMNAVHRWKKALAIETEIGVYFTFWIAKAS